MDGCGAKNAPGYLHYKKQLSTDSIDGKDDKMDIGTNRARKIIAVDVPPAKYTQEDFERAMAENAERIESKWRNRFDKQRWLFCLYSMRNWARNTFSDEQQRRMEAINNMLDDTCMRVVKLDQHLENCIGNASDMPDMEGMEMGKTKIDRRVAIDERVVRIRANSEEEYAQKLMSAMGAAVSQQEATQNKHPFRDYAEYWFVTFAKSAISQVTAITYERQLTRYLYPAFSDMCIEDITTADVQRLFNAMEGTKETKKKCKLVLNMILELAIEENLIQKNPLKSRSFRLTGGASKPTEPYSVEQMRFLVANIEKIKNPMDKAYIALQALHPLRLEEALGLRWMDIDMAALKIHVNHSVTHPDRNKPVFKETKTEGSNRILDLAPQIVKYLKEGKPEDFVIGGEKPLSYTQLRLMCRRIKKDTGFSENITPQRFRTTVLTDLYDATKDVKQVQNAAGHTTAEMTFKHYVKGRAETQNTAAPVANVYGLT